ncbi:MAG: hypothetical protein DSZ11_03885 [Sulfurovum sp.]|nr:MAG: hypothetical protein DSZ11_03885 [Sulfurovum sp.]
MKQIILLLTLIAFSTLATAEEETTLTDIEAKYSNKKKIEATEKLKQSVHLGFSGTTGNTDTLNLNAKYDFSFITDGYQNNPLKIAFDSSALFTENNDTRSNEEYLANFGLEQIITDGWLGYTGLAWLKNPKFKNYENKVGIGVGIGKELFNDGKDSLTLKLGTSYNVEDYANAQKTKEFGALNEYVYYANQLNKISNFYLKLGAMQNFDDMSKDYEVIGATGLNLTVTENIKLTLEGEVTYDNTPAIGFEKTDTKTIVSLGYDF